jgi:hypothetical protein
MITVSKLNRAQRTCGVLGLHWVACGAIGGDTVRLNVLIATHDLCDS